VKKCTTGDSYLKSVICKWWLLQSILHWVTNASVHLEINWTFSFIDHFISQHIKYFCPTYMNRIYSQCFPVTSSYSHWFSAGSSSWQRCCCCWSVLFWSRVFVLFLSQWLASRHVARVYKTPWDIGKPWLIGWLVGWLIWWMDEWMNESINQCVHWVKKISGLTAAGVPTWFYTDCGYCSFYAGGMFLFIWADWCVSNTVDLHIGCAWFIF
jgi:hypothetical protein